MPVKRVRILWTYPNIPLSTLTCISLPWLDAYLKTVPGLEIESELFETTYYRQNGQSSEDFRVQLGQILPSKSIHEYLGDMDDAIADFRKKVLEFQPDIIAVTATDFTHKIGENLIDGHRDWYPRKHICVVGGIFASFGYEYLLRFGQYDVIQRFEGFRSMEHIALHWDDNHLRECPNAVFRMDGKTVCNPLAPPVDMDTLPFPNYHLFPKWRMQRPMGGVIRSTLNYCEALGCPGHCAICCAPSIFGAYKEQGYCYCRVKSMDKIFEELKFAKEEYDINFVYFSSETFMLGSPGKFREFMLRYRDEVGLPFWMECRVRELLLPDYAKLLKDAGIDRVSTGLENGNEDYRKNVMGKGPFTNGQFVEAVRRTRDAGVKITVNAVLGCVDETRDTIFDTIRLMKDVAEGDTGVSLSTSVFAPCYGSRFREIALQKGYFDPDVWDNMDWSSFHMPMYGLDMPTLPFKEVQGIYRCFVPYTKMPYSMWDEIRKAEQDDEAFARIMAVYNEKYRNIG